MQKLSKIRNKKLKIAIGILLLPIVTALFFADRIVCVFLPWLANPSLRYYLDNMKLIEMAIWRVLTAFILILVYNLIF